MATDLELQLRAALAAHGTWKLRLKTAIATKRTDISPEIAACDDRCAFGIWLHGPDIDPDTKSSPPYRVTVRLHAEFHRAAGDALEGALSGMRRKRDRAAMIEFEQKSQKLNMALSKWLSEVKAPHSV
ncbi:MAG: CZB domain-containing protein [Paracoccaceae bacterium]